jgi:uncharacterized protein
MTHSVEAQVALPSEAIEQFCRKWDVQRFEVFGSVLRQDFDLKARDVDVMVSLSQQKPYTLSDLVHMEDELRAIFGREVHLTERPVVEESRNAIRRNHILSSAREVYVAA